MRCGLIIEVIIDDEKKDFFIKSDIAEIPTDDYSPNIKERVATVVSSLRYKKKHSFSSHYIKKILGCGEVEVHSLPLGGFLWDRDGMSRSGNIVSRLTLGKKDNQSIVDFSGKVLFFRGVNDEGEIDWFDCNNKEHMETLKQMINLFDVSIVPFAKVD
jgi:hypothetical protein